MIYSPSLYLCVTYIFGLQSKQFLLIMKIAYCLFGTYSTGGIERVTTVKANWLAEHGHEVFLITTKHTGRPPYYPLHPSIRHIDLSIPYEEPGETSRWKAYLHNRPRYKQHRQALNKLFMELRPDVAIAAGWHEAKVLGKLSDGSKKVIEHHSFRHMSSAIYPIYLSRIAHPSLLTRATYLLKTWWAELMTYKMGRYDQEFDQLVVLSEEDQALCTHCPTAVAIYNPLPFPFPANSSTLEEKVILGVGRLSNEKNFQELVDIWALIARDYPDWKLRIVGEGYAEPAIRERIAHHKLAEQVELRPFTPHVQEEYLQASIFCLTSVFEGFGLVLAEAESLGIPTIAYACPCGPRDIIREGEDGFLVQPGDRETFAQRLRQLIEDEALRKRMGQAAKKNAERFTLETIMPQWVALFEELTH